MWEQLQTVSTTIWAVCSVPRDHSSGPTGSAEAHFSVLKVVNQRELTWFSTTESEKHEEPEHQDASSPAGNWLLWDILIEYFRKGQIPSLVNSIWNTQLKHTDWFYLFFSALLPHLEACLKEAGLGFTAFCQIQILLNALSNLIRIFPLSWKIKF